MGSRQQAVGALVALAISTTMLTTVAGQGGSPASDHLRTAWGDPDLSGAWTNTTATGLERPDGLAEVEELTDEQRAALAAESARNLGTPPPPGQTGAYNSFWLDQGEFSARTSLIDQPSDGRVPALTPRAKARADDFTARWLAPPTSWHDMSLYDRYITRGLPGAMIPGFDNHNYLILQTPTHV